MRLKPRVGCDDRAVMEAAQIPWRRIGELLVGNGLITEQELEEALAEQASTNERLGEILVARRLVSSLDLTNVLMDQLGRELMDEEGSGSLGELRQLPSKRGRAAASESDPARDPTVAEHLEQLRRRSLQTRRNLEQAWEDLQRLRTVVSEREARISQLEAERASPRSSPEI
jgi:hypothetical protein